MSANDFNRQLIAEYRANGGTLPKGFAGGTFDNTPLLILTSTGSKSGEARESPLAYDRDGDRFVIIASKGGAPTHPAWYHNLKANPEVTVEVGAERFRGRATEQTGAERQRLYDQMAAKLPGFAEYQRKTDRLIPLFTIDRIA